MNEAARIQLLGQLCVYQPLEAAPWHGSLPNIVINVFSQPSTAIRIEERWDLGSNSLASPILRRLFDEHVRRALEAFSAPSGYLHSPIINTATQDPDELARYVDSAVIRIAAYNEMPIALMDSLIPRELIDEPMYLLARGVITPREAAQRLHNAITLWLIE